MSTFAKISTEFYKAFERKVRDGSGPESERAFYSLKDGSPEWMTDAIHSAHDALVGGRMPDDWVYEACRAILSNLVDRAHDDADSAREDMHEIADSQVDTYNTARYAWLASHIDNAELCDEACRELGTDSDASMADRIGVGQYHAYTLIGEALIGAIDAALDAADDDTDNACSRCAIDPTHALKHDDSEDA